MRNRTFAVPTGSNDETAAPYSKIPVPEEICLWIDIQVQEIHCAASTEFVARSIVLMTDFRYALCGFLGNHIDISAPIRTSFDDLAATLYELSAPIFIRDDVAIAVRVCRCMDEAEKLV